jgi:hypothetical protein
MSKEASRNGLHICATTKYNGQRFGGMELRGCTADKTDNYKGSELTDRDKRAGDGSWEVPASSYKMIRILISFPIMIGVFVRGGHSGFIKKLARQEGR